jgi:hypothetical protein
MREGSYEGVRHAESVTPEQAEAGLADARAAWLRRVEGNDPLGSCQVGYGLIKTLPLSPRWGWLPLWVAITDGERSGAVLLRLRASQVAAARANGEDPSAHALRWLQQMPTTDQHAQFEQVALGHPLQA